MCTLCTTETLRKLACSKNVAVGKKHKVDEKPHLGKFFDFFYGFILK